MPPHARNTVAVLLIGEDNTGYLNILATRHGTESSCSWTLPDAVIEPGEAPDAAADRVLHEQAGLVVSDTTLIATYNLSGQDEQETHTVYTFAAYITWAPSERADGLPSRDHLGAYWIREDNLNPDYPGLPADQYAVAANTLASMVIAQ